METYFKNMSAEEGTKQKLVQDLITLVHDAEDLIKTAGNDLSGKAKEELVAALERVKASCRRLEKEAVSLAENTDKLVRDHPYQAIGVGFLCGFVAGLLFNRR